MHGLPQGGRKNEGATFDVQVLLENIIIDENSLEFEMVLNLVLLIFTFVIVSFPHEPTALKYSVIMYFL